MPKENTYCRGEESLDIPGARCKYVHLRFAAAVLAADGPVHIHRFFVQYRRQQATRHSAPLFSSKAQVCASL